MAIRRLKYPAARLKFVAAFLIYAWQGYVKDSFLHIFLHSLFNGESTRLIAFGKYMVYLIYTVWLHDLFAVGLK
jgi:hypothetical protein